MIEVKITTKYSTSTRISKESTIREAFKAELNAIKHAGMRVSWATCSSDFGAILTERWGIDIRILIYEQKPRKIGLFEKIFSNFAA